MASGKKNYFRHHFNARNDDKVQDLMDKLGLVGYFYWFALVELCAELSADEMPEKFVFHQRTLIKELRLRKDKLHISLGYMQDMSLISYTNNGNKIEIGMPKLSKYMGRYTTKNTPNTPNKSKVKESKVKENKKGTEVPADIKKIINYLNKKSGKKFRDDSKTAIKFINQRLAESYTIDDFYKVIDVKVSHSVSGSFDKKYLRPETLFGNKFDGYLNEEFEKSEEQEAQEATDKLTNLIESALAGAN